MWKHLHGDWSQIPANAPKQNRPPDSRLPPNSDHISRLLYISCYHSRHRQNLISIFPASYERRTRPVKRDGHWLLHYIRSRQIISACPLSEGLYLTYTTFRELMYWPFTSEDRARAVNWLHNGFCRLHGTGYMDLWIKQAARAGRIISCSVLPFLPVLSWDRHNAALTTAAIPVTWNEFRKCRGLFEVQLKYLLGRTEENQVKHMKIAAFRYNIRTQEHPNAE
jgi:hypothetical protein